MARVKIDKSIATQVGVRLHKLVTEHLQVSWADFAKILGYSNPSTLFNIKAGNSFIGMEKLQKLATEKFNEKHVSINWLLTGYGPIFLEESSEASSNAEKIEAHVKYDEDAIGIALINILRRTLEQPPFRSDTVHMNNT